VGRESVLLVAAALVAALASEREGGACGALLLLLAMSIGLQSAAARRLAVPDVTTVVLTSVLTAMAVDSSLAGGTNPRLARRVGAVLAILSGAVAGAFLMRRGLAWTIGTRS